jgi:hypothetical protein
VIRSGGRSDYRFSEMESLHLNGVVVSKRDNATHTVSFRRAVTER